MDILLAGLIVPFLVIVAVVLLVVYLARRR
jgi:hypothetical protein